MENTFDFVFNAYKNFYSEDIIKYEAITNAGSNRNYYRIYTNSDTIIGVYSNNVEETETFLYYSEIFTTLSLNTPKVFFVSPDKKCYFIQDLGNISLLEIVERETKNSDFNSKLVTLYKKTISALVNMQINSASLIDFDRAYSIKDFDKQSILFDLNYFKYYLLNVSGITYNEKKLADDFVSLADYLDKSGNKYFMYRDFQGRNILIKDNKPYFIDYQGGRRGAIQYDLVSLLYQAKAKVPEFIKNELLIYYVSEVSKYIEVNRNEFINQFYYYAYLRVLQTLGAYGLRGLFEKKTHFIESIPFALNNLKVLLQNYPLPEEYKELNRVLKELSETTKFENIRYNDFTITITSFSYKKGIPDDYSGNGGGFVFDCRGVLNPGRYPEYKSLTGRDKEVIDFFKEKTDIDSFIDNIIKVIAPTIDNYIQRNFNSLMISFGCTGGQHRSVYCAENITRYLKNNYNVNIVLVHREQNIKEVIPKKLRNYNVQ
jgi:aminoglycoside/choline kinase family phosphotransferase